MKKGVSATLFILTFLLPLSASAAISITEIMYDPEGSDSKQEWIELYNDGPDAVNIGDWKYADKSNHALNTPPKNGGVGTTMIAPGRYFILASDAATFVAAHPSIAIVIDTTMSLNNTGMTLGIREGTEPVAVATYAKTQGAAGNGDSLQLSGGVWIHAKPTPGAANATTPSTESKPIPVEKKPVQSAPLTPQPIKAAPTPVDTAESNDPLSVVNAEPEAVTQTAAAASLTESLGSTYWWFAAAALAIGSGAAVSLISRTKKNEWDIEESE